MQIPIKDGVLMMQSGKKHRQTVAHQAGQTFQGCQVHTVQQETNKNNLQDNYLNHLNSFS